MNCTQSRRARFALVTLAFCLFQSLSLRASAEPDAAGNGAEAPTEIDAPKADVASKVRESPKNSEPTEIFVRGATFVESLAKVPQSTTIVTGSQIVESGAQSFENVIDTVPGLSWSGGTSRPRFFLIRGVGELEQYEGAPNPSVATIVDGIDFSGLGLIVPLFDVDQIEVLRGPQGVRFGSSALAGALNLSSAEPTATTRGVIEIGAGNDELRHGGFAVGGAVAGTDDRLQLRVSGYSSRSDGFRHDLYLDRDDTNERDESLLRAKLRYEANSWLTVNAAAFTVDQDNGYDAFAIDNSLTTQSDRPGRDELRTNAASIGFDARLPGDTRLVETFSTARIAQDYSYDGDWGNNPFWAPYDPYDYFSDTDRTRRTLANELRWFSDSPDYIHGDSWRWLSGLYLQRLGEDAVTREFSNNEIYDSLSSNYHAKTGAVFGEVEAPLGSGTSLAIGGRVEQRSAEYDDSRSTEFSPDYTMLGGNLVLSHDIDAKTRAYLSASRGFKGGGFNAGPSVPDDRRRYNPEYLWNFETGVKGSWFDNRLSGSTAVFHQLRRDQQLKLAIQDNPEDPLSFTYVTESTARGASTGIESEITVRALDWLSVFGSAAVMDTEYTSVPEESNALDGRQFSAAPTWEYSAGTRADLGAGFFARAEYVGRDRYYYDDTHNERSTPYYLLNASAGWHRDGWSVVTWARNLLDERYPVRGFFFGNEPPDYANKEYIQRGDPRAFGVTVRYDF